MHPPVDRPTPQAPIHLWLRTWLIRLATAGLGLSGLVLLAPKLAWRWPDLGLAALVHMPAAWLGLGSTLGLLFAARDRRARLGFGVSSFVFVVALLPATRAPAPCPPNAQRLTLAWLNAHAVRNSPQIHRWLQRARADVIGFAEMHQPTGELARYLERTYPFRQNCQVEGECSTWLYTKIPPMEHLGLARGDAENRQTLSGAGMVFPPVTGARAWKVAAVHLSRPTAPNAQASELAQFETRMGADADTLMLGDFNLSPRLPVLQDFVARNGLAITRSDRPTWPLEFGERRLEGLWQIDHLLTGRHWQVESFETSLRLGSDHRGFIAKVCQVG
ncbi:endonuclease/exonuclease/phosphatase family protein [Novosphingobium sp. BW1]|uniref:endonuclease/exonuclease/phosphatase family protein n=1 Tax=Novosphingobium sp. BW1 TaxID=2592621 RepID=UPI0011DEEA6F|nr:endonuclease/exonuclease/phosphatase family protein [Novosphingobium sp. BW1]TYC85606.1 endonuclease/exonuclease/phosphatase family protein [Novosphingobium sp. BW1]